jgi:hypothetical protein
LKVGSSDEEDVNEEVFGYINVDDFVKVPFTKEEEKYMRENSTLVVLLKKRRTVPK